MLSGSFLELSQAVHQPGSISGQVFFNKDHAIFKGHFPSVPVVPGVCMMQAIKEITAQQTGQSLRITKAAQLKFISPINPLVTPSVFVSITYHKTGETIDVQAELKNPPQVYFKMKATLSLQQ